MKLEDVPKLVLGAETLRDYQELTDITLDTLDRLEAAERVCTKLHAGKLTEADRLLPAWPATKGEDK